MLEYGQSFLDQNQEALGLLESLMTSAGFSAAVKMAPLQDETDADIEIEEPLEA